MLCASFDTVILKNCIEPRVVLHDLPYEPPQTATLLESSEASASIPATIETSVRLLQGARVGSQQHQSGRKVDKENDARQAAQSHSAQTDPGKKDKARTVKQGANVLDRVLAVIAIIKIDKHLHMTIVSTSSFTHRQHMGIILPSQKHSISISSPEFGFVPASLRVHSDSTNPSGTHSRVHTNLAVAIRSPHVGINYTDPKLTRQKLNHWREHRPMLPLGPSMRMHDHGTAPRFAFAAHGCGRAVHKGREGQAVK